MGIMSKVRCTMHKDCFANIDGKCICLKDNIFKNNKCPFYKTKARPAAENSGRCSDAQK